MRRQLGEVKRKASPLPAGAAAPDSPRPHNRKRPRPLSAPPGGDERQRVPLPLRKQTMAEFVEQYPGLD